MGSGTIGDVPFIRCVDVISHPVITDNQPFERIPKDFIESNRSIRTVKAGDIVITKVGTPCYAGFVHEDLGYAALTRTVLGVTEVTEYLPTLWPVEIIGQWGRVLKGRSVSNYIETGVPVIRSGDLSDLDNLQDLKYADPNETLFYLQQGDVCISSIGFGSIGKVQVFDKADAYATVSEVTVIRQQRVNPYYLQIFLRSRPGQLQIEKYITGATGQLHLYPRDVANISVPILPIEQQAEFENLVIKSRQYKQKALSLFEEAKRRLEEMIMKEGTV